MRITKKRIIQLDNYLRGVAPGAEFRAVSDALSPTALKRVGFSESSKFGDAVLPRIVGPVTRFNARGRWLVRRDLPKEPRYIRTVWWTRKQWAGRGKLEEHADFRDIFRDCYPRELVPPPSIELLVLPTEHGQHIATPVLRHTADNSEFNKHCINLMLECVGELSITLADGSVVSPPTVRRLHWKLLPPGEYPWSKLEGHLQELLVKRSQATAKVIFDRQETLRSYGPTEIFVGEAGFDDYLAYVFSDREIVILESIRKDNALYALGANWRRVSQMSKAEILGAGLQEGRIVHSSGWKGRLARFMAQRRAA